MNGMPLLKARKQHLDNITLDVEFLLISVIQGAALVTLAGSAVEPLTSLQFSTWPYILAVFLFILIFWSGAIIHAVSFIDWPIDLVHSLLYFLASLVEIMAITNLTHPLSWFSFLLLFQMVAFVLYVYDLQIIKQHAKKFSFNQAGKKLYEHIITEQQKELKLFLPASSLLFIVALVAMYLQPKVLLKGGNHEAFIALQIVFALSFLIKEVKTFKRRTALLLQVGEK